jgi:hypothetical protein
MTSTRPPSPLARLGVGLAVRALPTRADRDRYYSEFVAELYGLPASVQLRHTAGVLSQAFALRAALGDSRSPIEEKAVPSTPLGRRLRCRILRWHHWHTYSTDDGGLYKACTVCRKDHPGQMGPFNTIGQ